MFQRLVTATSRLSLATQAQRLVPRHCTRSIAASAVQCTAATTSARPFRVLGLQQIAVGGLEKSKLSFLWEGLFGVPKVGTFVSEKENVDEDILKLGPGPWGVEIDLMQPLNPEVSPKVHVPPLNHIGLWVDDIHKATDWLTEQGVRFTPGGIRKGAAGFDVIFIHPKGSDAEPHSGNGVLIELVQAPEHVIAAHDNYPKEE